MAFGNQTRRLIPGFTASLMILLVAGCLQLRVGDSEAGLVLEDLVTDSSRLRERAPPPGFRSLRVSTSAAPLRADLYVPGGAARAGMVLVPGLAVAGKNDPRLVGLARTLAPSCSSGTRRRSWRRC